MLSANWIRISIFAAALVAAAIVWASGDDVDVDFMRALVSASAVVVGGVLLYDARAWRWRGIRRLTKRPVIHGTWKVELRTSWKERQDEVIEAYLVVRQTYSRVSVAMLLERSRSRSMSGDIVFEDGECRLYYLFAKQTNALQLDGNPSSRGGATLTIGRKPIVRLDGDYWTDQGTRGEVRSVGHNKETDFGTFDAARGAEYS